MTIDDILKQAARDYLRAIEGSGPISDVEKAKERLAEVAVLWAQAEAISQLATRPTTWLFNAPEGMEWEYVETEPGLSWTGRSRPKSCP